MARRLPALAVPARALSGLALAVATMVAVPSPAPAAAPPDCAPPAPGQRFPTATPEQVQLDPAAVRDAVHYAATHLRLSVQVFRHGCLVGAAPQNALTLDVPWNVWSSTKSVVSMLTGIAESQGALDLDDPIGDHLPARYGDAAHRAITIRQLLTETSGLDEAIISEAATILTDPDVVHEALAQPIEHEPGTHFRYSQRTPDLLAFVVEQAVGEDLQAFAQRELFTPIGIRSTDYFWLRDRSGHTYGYANLFIRPRQYARLGLLMQHGGRWGDQQVVPADYLRRAETPTATNGCYGFLFWTNAGEPCTGASIPTAVTIDQRAIESAPHDLYAMVGAFQQNNFAIPSLDMTVSWTGLLGDTTVNNLSGLMSALPADLYHEFFRRLMRGVEDVEVPDPGPLTLPDDFAVDPLAFADPALLLRGLVPTSRCNVLVCDGRVPLTGLLQNLRSITAAILAPR